MGTAALDYLSHEMEPAGSVSTRRLLVSISRLIRQQCSGKLVGVSADGDGAAGQSTTAGTAVLRKSHLFGVCITSRQSALRLDPTAVQHRYELRRERSLRRSRHVELRVAEVVSNDGYPQ